MRFVKYASTAILALLVFASLPTQADVLVLNAPARRQALFQVAPGQSVTTPNGGPFNTLSFNWFGANKLPTASGTLFLLDSEYTGVAGDLSNATPGFLAASQNISGGQYIFDPTVTLKGATQYFFFNNQDLNYLADGSTYAGGSLYLPINNDITQPFINVDPQDAYFRLSGVTAVPEPSTFAFLAGSVLTGAAFLRRRKQA